MSKHLINLGPEEFLISGLHEGGELNLVGAISVDIHLVHVTIHLKKIFMRDLKSGLQPSIERHLCQNIIFFATH